MRVGSYRDQPATHPADIRHIRAASAIANQQIKPPAVTGRLGVGPNTFEASGRHSPALTGRSTPPTGCYCCDSTSMKPSVAPPLKPVCAAFSVVGKKPAVLPATYSDPSGPSTTALPWLTVSWPK